MDRDPFERRRPYLDTGIDFWKVFVVGMLFLALLAWLPYIK